MTFTLLEAVNSIKARTLAERQTTCATNISCGGAAPGSSATFLTLEMILSS